MYGLQKTFSELASCRPVQNVFANISIRGTKHWDPKFRWHRSKKFIRIDLPDLQEKMTKEKLRTKLKKLGIAPSRYWRDRPMTVFSLSEIVEPYKPPEADGKASFLSKERVDKVKDKYAQWRALRMIKSYDSNFNIKLFPQVAHDIYVNAHTTLMKKDHDELSDYATERAISEMTEGLKFKTLRWSFIESLEPPIVVQAKTAPVVTENNFFAQITVRFHTKQTLAIYDRFGRLMYGNEVVPKDVLEYVVFEKHIVNEYGTWKLHGKIIPDWMPARESAPRTYRVAQAVEEEDDELENMVEEQHEPLQTAESEGKDVATVSY